MESSLVSIIVPCYNRGHLIGQCIDNLLLQTYNNIEIIIVDDGSQDNTEEIVSLYNDSRIKYYRYSPNKGACFARNYGIKKARGKYIAFQDSDDIWECDKIENQLSYLIQTDSDLVFCSMERISLDKKNSFIYPIRGFNNEENALKQLLYDNRISTQTILIKKEVADFVKFDVSFKKFQDWDFALHVAKSNYKISFLSKTLVKSVVQNDSITSLISGGKAYEHIYEKYEKYYLLNPEAHAQILKNMAWAYRKNSRIKALKYWKKSLKYKMDIKVLIRIILLQFHVSL